MKKTLHYSPYVMRRLWLVLVMAVVGASQSWAAGWYYYYLNAEASPSEGGTVYASTSSSAPDESSYQTSFTSGRGTASAWGSTYTLTVYYFAQANDGYEFVGWQDADGNIVSTSASSTFTFSGSTSLDLNIPTYTISYTAVFKKTLPTYSLNALASQATVGLECIVFKKNLVCVGHFTASNGDKYLAVRDDDENMSCYNWVNVSFSEYQSAANMVKDENGNEIDQKQFTQNNWALVKISNDEDYDKVGISVSSITGTVTDATNITIDATEIEWGSEEKETALNTYTPINFMGETLVTAGGTDYFFMTPKRSELANVMWLVWDGSNFYLPADKSNNPYGLAGGVKPVWDYNESGDVSSQLTVGQSYKVTAIVKEIASAASASRKATPYTDGGKSSTFEIYPLNIDDVNNIVTSVTDAQTERQVQSVSYYDLSGRQSAQPFDGVNVVVTRYTDGTQSSAKVVK